jgi:hypothetical protein
MLPRDRVPAEEREVEHLKIGDGRGKAGSG